MTQKIYVVEGRKFRTEADYQNALKDQQVIENLRMQTKKNAYWRCIVGHS